MIGNGRIKINRRGFGEYLRSLDWMNGNRKKKKGKKDMRG
jgi:hypothetical protein